MNALLCRASGGVSNACFHIGDALGVCLSVVLARAVWASCCGVVRGKMLQRISAASFNASFNAVDIEVHSSLILLGMFAVEFHI